MNLTYFQLTVAILGGYKPVRYAENAKVGLIQGGKLNNVYMISIILGDISYQSSMSLWKLKKDCRSGVNHEINRFLLFMQNGVVDEQLTFLALFVNC